MTNARPIQWYFLKCFGLIMLWPFFTLYIFGLYIMVSNVVFLWVLYLCVCVCMRAHANLCKCFLCFSLLFFSTYLFCFTLVWLVFFGFFLPIHFLKRERRHEIRQVGRCEGFRRWGRGICDQNTLHEKLFSIKKNTITPPTPKRKERNIMGQRKLSLCEQFVMPKGPWSILYKEANLMQ